MVWPENYYREEHAGKRKELLEQNMLEHPEDRVNELRNKLWEARYQVNGKQPDPPVDLYIGGWMNMIYLARNSTAMFTGRHTVRELKKTLKEMAFEAVKDYGQEGEEAFFQEICQLSRLYCRICTNDRRYGTKMMGLVPMKNEDITVKIAAEVERIAYYLPQKCGMEDSMRIFAKGVTQGFLDVFPDEQEKLTALITGYR